MSAILTTRDAATVTGADAATYLHGQASQDIVSMAVGESRWTFLLAPTGKVDVLARVTRRGDDTFVFDVDAGFGDELVARLNRFKIRVAVDVAPTALVVAVPAAGEPTDSSAGGTVAGWFDGPAHVVVSAGDGPDDEGLPDDPARYDAARVAAGWPAMGAEIEPGATIPGETGLIGVAVTLGKGCYPGQELVERMDSRGATAPRSLQSAPAPDGAGPGDPIVVDGQTVGTWTSVAGGRALGYVKRGVTLT